MFIRFRRSGHRLQLSIAETRRVDGRVRQEHVAALGSVNEQPSVQERVEFWQRLHERLAKLSNRIDATMQGKLLGEIHARIPMVTLEEIRALQLENAEADASLWESIRDMNQDQADGHKELKAKAVQAIARDEAAAAKAAAEVAAAKDRIERIKRGEDVQGGLGKRVDFEQILRNAGWTTADLQHARVMALLPEEAISRLVELELEAGERASRATARRMARALLELPNDDDSED